MYNYGASAIYMKKHYRFHPCRLNLVVLGEENGEDLLVRAASIDDIESVIASFFDPVAVVKNQGAGAPVMVREGAHITRDIGAGRGCADRHLMRGIAGEVRGREAGCLDDPASGGRGSPRVAFRLAGRENGGWVMRTHVQGDEKKDFGGGEGGHGELNMAPKSPNGNHQSEETVRLAERGLLLNLGFNRPDEENLLIRGARIDGVENLPVAFFHTVAVIEKEDGFRAPVVMGDGGCIRGAICGELGHFRRGNIHATVWPAVRWRAFFFQVPSVGLLRPDAVVRFAGDPNFMNGVFRSKAQGDEKEDLGGGYGNHG